jgi:acetyl-CoA carboxylase biotin carboxyl carrier protein
MELDEMRQLMAWTESAGFRSLEVRRPGERLSFALERDGEPSGAVVGESAATSGLALRPRAIEATLTVHAESAGVFVASHPMRGAPFAAVGAAVDEGDLLGLLRIGHLLVPVAAPARGIVVRVVAADGSVQGFGSPLVELRTESQAAGPHTKHTANRGRE